MEIDRTKGGLRDRLLSLRREERSMRRELNMFQEQNNLSREPQYPDSEILHWAIVAALVVTESLANAYFFAKGSDLGLLGGAFQAFLISFVNIGAALLAGIYLMRNLHHILGWRLALSAMGLCGYLVFMVFLNLATAHYRAQLGIDPLTALVKVFLSLYSSPFAINDFDATILLFIGVIFAISALTKAYFADDRYPGYGEIDRRYRETDEAYQEGRHDLRVAVNTVVDTARAELHRYVSEATQANHDFSALLAEAETISSEYVRHTAELCEARYTLLNTYRTTNTRVRTSSPPDYFDEYPPTDGSDDLPQANLNRERERTAEIDEQLVQIEKGATEVMSILKEVNETALRDLAPFFQGVEDEVDRKIAADARESKVGAAAE